MIGRPTPRMSAACARPRPAPHTARSTAPVRAAIALARRTAAAPQVVLLAAVLAALLGIAGRAGAQADGYAADRPRLKPAQGREAPVAAAACPRFSPPPPTPAARREQARQVAALGQEAAIIGNRRAAREQLQRAADLDPADGEVAYQLARMLDESGSAEQAVREYCRYLSLAPPDPDTADVRARIAELTPARRVAPGDAAGEAFAAGVQAYDSGRVAAAESALSAALALRPRWAEAYYDRGVVRRALGERLDAARDFRHYLELTPAAQDSAEVLAWIDSLVPPPRFDARGTFRRGLLFPGLGQLHTDRPALAAAAMVATGAALGVAFQVREDVRRRIVNTEGIPIVYRDTLRTRPNLGPGLAAAVAITGLAAYEAYTYATRAWRARESVAPARGANSRSAAGPLVLPTPSGVAVGVRVTLGGGEP